MIGFNFVVHRLFLQIDYMYSTSLVGIYNPRPKLCGFIILELKLNI